MQRFATLAKILLLLKMELLADLRFSQGLRKIRSLQGSESKKTY